MTTKECKKCETLYDEETHYICPRCEQEKLFEMGLELSRENKQKREKDVKQEM